MTGEGKAARSDSAERARVRLVGALDGVLGERLVIEPGTKPDYYADGVAVSGFDLLERCPRRAAQPADDYQDSVANARRRVGLLTLRRLDDDASDAPDVAAAVAEVMSDPTGWPGPLREWVDGLDRAGRAAVAAGVITWCISLRRVLRTDRRIGWSDPVGPDGPPTRRSPEEWSAVSSSWSSPMASRGPAGRPIDFGPVTSHSSAPCSRATPRSG
jgi:hypothetical protein